MKVFGLAKRMFVICAALVLVAACSGGGSSGSKQTSAPGSQDEQVADSGADSDSDSGSGSDSDADSEQDSEQDDGSTDSRSYVSPGEYATVSDCVPFQGSEVGELKIVFVNLDDATHFDAVVDDAVAHFQTIAPWDEFFQNLALYRTSLSSADFECEDNSSSCDIERIHQAISAECKVEDLNGIVKIVLTESDYSRSAGEVIYIRLDSTHTEAEALHGIGKDVIHEVAHNFGLADFSTGGYRKDGSPVQGWASSNSRQWLNLDGPGCPKWCDSYKPASEYTLSESAQCKNFSERDACVAFNRDSDGRCEDADGDGQYDCCAWSEDSTDDYFGSSCAPVVGTEDIGLACLDGAGCFYGGAYGNNSWRPVETREESIMFSHHSDAFDSVSQRSIREVMRCCASGEDSSSACDDFRAEYADFLHETMQYKQRIGSCGVLPD